MEKFIVVFGDPLTGYVFYGPFNSDDDAHAYALYMCEARWYGSPHWYIAELEPPNNKIKGV